MRAEDGDVIELTARIAAVIVEHARKEAPLEACGLLAGRDGRALRYYAMTNADRSPEHFSMLPEEQFAAAKDMRARGLELIAICHSHPATPARLSDEDLRLALMPGAVHIVISLLDPSRPEVRGFRVDGGRPEEQSIKVTQE